jgi:hypothetical protein
VSGGGGFVPGLPPECLDVTRPSLSRR